MTDHAHEPGPLGIKTRSITSAIKTNGWSHRAAARASRRIYTFTNVHLTIQIELRWWLFISNRTCRLKVEPWRLETWLLFCRFTTRHVLSTDEKAFHISPTTDCKLASWRPAVHSSCIQEHTEHKKSCVYLTEDQLAAHLFRRYDDEEEEMSGFPSVNALFTFHTAVKPRLILIKRPAHTDTHSVYLSNGPLGLVRLKGRTQRAGQNSWLAVWKRPSGCTKPTTLLSRV